MRRRSIADRLDDAERQFRKLAFEKIDDAITPRRQRSATP
jgi:hypothetical protein